ARKDALERSRDEREPARGPPLGVERVEAERALARRRVEDERPPRLRVDPVDEGEALPPPILEHDDDGDGALDPEGEAPPTVPAEIPGDDLGLEAPAAEVVAQVARGGAVSPEARARLVVELAPVEAEERGEARDRSVAARLRHGLDREHRRAGRD